MSMECDVTKKVAETTVSRIEKVKHRRLQQLWRPGWWQARQEKERNAEVRLDVVEAD